MSLHLLLFHYKGAKWEEISMFGSEVEAFGEKI